VEKNHMNVIRDLVWHGVGRKVHEEPQVPNYGRPKTGPILEPGMTLAFEPMVALGDYAVLVDKDNQTYRTNDNSLAAQFEHTIVVTEKGGEIITENRK
jgi:methionyl aminopeptidase